MVGRNEAREEERRMKRTKTMYAVVSTISDASNRCHIEMRTRDIEKAKRAAAKSGQLRVITCTVGQRWEYGDVVRNAHGFGVAA